MLIDEHINLFNQICSPVSLAWSSRLQTCQETSRNGKVSCDSSVWRFNSSHILLAYCVQLSILSRLSPSIDSLQVEGAVHNSWWSVSVRSLEARACLTWRSIDTIELDIVGFAITNWAANKVHRSFCCICSCFDLLQVLALTGFPLHLMKLLDVVVASVFDTIFERRDLWTQQLEFFVIDRDPVLVYGNILVRPRCVVKQLLEYPF